MFLIIINLIPIKDQVLMYLYSAQIHLLLDLTLGFIKRYTGRGIHQFNWGSRILVSSNQFIPASFLIPLSLLISMTIRGPRNQLFLRIKWILWGQILPFRWFFSMWFSVSLFSFRCFFSSLSFRHLRRSSFLSFIFSRSDPSSDRLRLLFLRLQSASPYNQVIVLFFQRAFNSCCLHSMLS